MILTIHRGSDQIGGSCVEIQSENGARLVLDVGMPLTKPDGNDWPRGTMVRPSDELRNEGILPNIDGLYADSKPGISALILSHAHLDHYGLAHHVHPKIPVYGSFGTIEMLRASKLFVPDAVLPKDLRELPRDHEISVATFLVHGINVDHAAPDSRALLVEADGQRLLYSGDLRAHGRLRHLFDELPKTAGLVDVLVLEGTTIGQPQGSHGFVDEIDVERHLTKLLTRDVSIVIIIASGQNVDRAVSAYRAALAAGRELVIDPYQAYVLMALKDIYPEAPQYDSPSVRVKFIPYHVAKLKGAGLWSLVCKMSRASKVTIDQLAANPSGFVYLARSSGATVAQMRVLARTTRPTIVWSQWSDYLAKDGPVARFCDEQNIEPVVIHSGGHAHPEDLIRLVNLIQPKAVVPIHTQGSSQFTKIFPRVKIVNDGIPTEVSSMI